MNNKKYFIFDKFVFDQLFKKNYFIMNINLSLYRRSVLKKK